MSGALGTALLLVLKNRLGLRNPAALIFFRQRLYELPLLGFAEFMGIHRVLVSPAFGCGWVALVLFQFNQGFGKGLAYPAIDLC